MQQKTTHKLHEKVNDDIRLHIEKLNDGEWPHRDFLQEMYDWVDIFTNRLDLAIPVPLLGVKKMRKTRLGQYREGRNEHALPFQILFNETHLGRPLWKHLATLLHELGHEWQHARGEAPKTRGHNKQFCGFMAEFGLIVSRKGVTTVEAGSFTELLDEHGVDYDLSAEDPPEEDEKRIPKITWSCRCEQFPIKVEAGIRPNIECKDCNKPYAAVK